MSKLNEKLETMIADVLDVILADYMETIGETSENGECLGDMQSFLMERDRHPSFWDGMTQEEENDRIREVYKREYCNFVQGLVVNRIQKDVEKRIFNQ